MINISMLTATYTYYHGPSHGWIAIPKKLLDHVGYRPTRFSYYDHQSDTVYLEEDCDATRFTDLFKTKTKMDLQITEKYIADESMVRRWGRTGL